MVDKRNRRRCGNSTAPKLSWAICALCTFAVYAVEHEYGSPDVALGKPSAGQPVKFSASFQLNDTSARYVVVHDRILHVVVIGRDLDTFTHVHPEDFGFNNSNGAATTAAFNLSLTFPAGGDYLLAVDAALTTGAELANTRLVAITGPPDLVAFNTSRVDNRMITVRSTRLQQPLPFMRLSSLLTMPDMPNNGSKDLLYHVQLTGPSGDACIPGQASNYTITVMHAATMEPVLDLQNYLGAAMHLNVVSHGLGFATHVHGEATGTTSDPMDMGAMDHTVGVGGVRESMAATTFGPSVYAVAKFPSPNVYVMVAQLRRGDELIFAPFYIRCGLSSATPLRQAVDDMTMSHNQSGNATHNSVYMSHGVVHVLLAACLLLVVASVVPSHAFDRCQSL